MKGRKRTTGNKLSRLFGAGAGRLLLDENGQPVVAEPEEVTEDQDTEDYGVPIVTAPLDLRKQLAQESARPAAPPRPAEPVPAAPPPGPATPPAAVKPPVSAPPARVEPAPPPARVEPARPAARGDVLGRPHRGPATLQDVTPQVPASTTLIPEMLSAAPLTDEEGVDDEPTAPAELAPPRPVGRIENLARRATVTPPPPAAAPPPAAPLSPTGFALLPHEEDMNDDTAPQIAARAGARSRPVEPGPRAWADESLFDDPTPPAATRRPELSVLTGEGPSPAERARRPASPFQILRDESPPARPAPTTAASLVSEPPRAQPAPSPRPIGRAPVDMGDEPRSTGPLRVFLGAAGAQGPSARRVPPPDVSGPIWDATAVAFRRYDSDDMLSSADEDAVTEEDAGGAARGGNGALPRTWLDPNHLPASLDKMSGARPRRVGGVVQAVPGTPSAIAIAREEAESARLGPPPPLVSPPPFLMASSWSSQEPDLSDDLPSSDPFPRGEAPRAESPRLIQSPTPPVPRLGERPSTREREPEPKNTVPLYALVGFLVVLLVGGALLYLTQGRRAASTEEAAAPEPAPLLTEAVEAQPVPTPPPPVVEPTPPPVAANPCDAPADAPLTGGLLVQSAWRGKLYVDGKNCGTLPLAAPLRLLPGTHRVQLRGQRSLEQTVRVDAERTTKVEF